MTRQQDGVAVALKTTHGKLSDDEAAAIAKLSGALEKTLSGLDNGNGKLDVGDLLSFDSNQLASVDLKTDLRRSGEVMQSLNLHAGPGSRWLGFHNADASFKLTTDMRSLAQASNAGQQQSALAQWSTKFDQAASRGHGDRAALALFKQGFESLNSTSAAAGVAMRTPAGDHRRRACGAGRCHQRPGRFLGQLSPDGALQQSAEAGRRRYFRSGCGAAQQPAE